MHYDNSHSSLDERVCCVCGDGRSFPRNDIIFCDGKDCDISVHMKCYGIKGELPEGDWFCYRCQDKISVKSTKIVCCPDRGGALLKTTVPSVFVHVVCVAWNKLLSLSSLPVFVHPFSVDKWPCDICGIIKGTHVKCALSSCQTWFHVTCAVEKNLIKPCPVTRIKHNARCSAHQVSNRQSAVSIDGVSSSVDRAVTSATSEVALGVKRKPSPISDDEFVDNDDVMEEDSVESASAPSMVSESSEEIATVKAPTSQASRGGSHQSSNPARGSGSTRSVEERVRQPKPPALASIPSISKLSTPPIINGGDKAIAKKFAASVSLIKSAADELMSNLPYFSGTQVPSGSKQLSSSTTMESLHAEMRSLSEINLALHKRIKLLEAEKAEILRRHQELEQNAALVLKHINIPDLSPDSNPEGVLGVFERLKRAADRT